MQSGHENFQVMSRLLVLYQQHMKIQLQMKLESKSAEVDQRKLLLSVWGQVYNWFSFSGQQKQDEPLRWGFGQWAYLFSFFELCLGGRRCSVFCLVIFFLLLLFFGRGLLNPILMKVKLCTSKNPASVSTWRINGGRLHWDSLKDTKTKVTETREKRGWMR